jgi:nitrate reductase delta subunit
MTMTAPETIARAVAGRLLLYPETEAGSRQELQDLRRVVDSLPARLRGGLVAFIDTALAAPLLQRQSEYVATFDQKRRCCLYLSYYLNGDTRLRGMALVRFKEVYEAAGLRFDDSELPDFLPVVLEFSLEAEAEAVGLLQQHRRGLELLRTSLHQMSSAYADVIDVVIATLPAADSAELEAASLLAVQGPPAEQVGLEPFGPAELTGVGIRS